MMKSAKFFLFLLGLCCTALVRAGNPEISSGVSRELALHRKSVLSDLHYTLHFNIPPGKDGAITASEKLTFKLRSVQYPLLLDFRERPEKIQLLQVNGKTVPLHYQQEHLVLQPAWLKKGKNEVQVSFLSGEAALNRNADYLYTLFVPDRARTVFPCFDQPDLKAVFTLSLQVPQDWEVIANGRLQDKLVSPGRKTWRFKPTALLSTYLFGFAAGKFSVQQGTVANMPVRFLYRETDSARIRNSMPEIFSIHQQALRYFEQWTAVPYPFQQLGFVALPDFQFGGMEHPGAVEYKSSTLFLDAGATQDQLNARNNLIAHETAHMWFGDLVTMDWFSDVWMKEVFANFMADKSAGNTIDQQRYALKFLVDHLPAAYAVDRTAGANPIRQQLDNLSNAGSLYGNIIYHKAPVMMRQLETLMGAEAFRQGIREYLKKFAYGNASWPDLIGILDRHTTADLQGWNTVWVNESGRPVIDYQVSYTADHISRFTLSQHAEQGQERFWPQAATLTLFYADSLKTLPFTLQGKVTELETAKGLPRPLFVLFNSGGEGYGVWPADPALTAHLSGLKSPLHRAVAYITLYEQVLNGKLMSPAALLKLFDAAILQEQEELNIRLLSAYMDNLYWQFSTPGERSQSNARLEQDLWGAMLKEKNSAAKKQLFNGYVSLFPGKEADAKLYRIWEQQLPPAGLKLAEDDYSNLALSLAVRTAAGGEILKTQLSRITNSDRRERFAFIMPAADQSADVRDKFFKSLQQLSGRNKEANVLAALAVLHHPLRQRYAQHYLRESLEMLPEIQATGDIFFPQSFLQASFGRYQSAEAAEIVRNYLAAHPELQPALRGKILQSCDNLFRAERLLKGHKQE